MKLQDQHARVEIDVERTMKDCVWEGQVIGKVTASVTRAEFDIIFDAEVDLSVLAKLATRALCNKSRSAKSGALRVKITSSREVPESRVTKECK